MTTAIQEGDSSGFRVGPYGDVESVQADGECRFVVQCLSLNDGKLIWEHQAAKGAPRSSVMPKAVMPTRHQPPTESTWLQVSEEKVFSVMTWRVACFGKATWRFG